MAEKEEIFSSKVGYNGIFSFSEFYNFCYDWLTEEVGLGISEDKYAEKLQGDSKNIDVEWTGEKKITDYFKFQVKVQFKITGLAKVEVLRGKTKVRTNQGGVKVATKGILIRDYKGKFEKSGFQKFLRAIYEKWVIHARIEQMEDKLVGACDGFLSQAKAYLDLEGKR